MQCTVKLYHACLIGTPESKEDPDHGGPQASLFSFFLSPLQLKSHWVCRVFMWGARSGVEQLPPFPEPSHNAEGFHHPLPSSGRGCVVGFQSPERQGAAPLVVSFHPSPSCCSDAFLCQLHTHTLKAVTNCCIVSFSDASSLSRLRQSLQGSD